MSLCCLPDTDSSLIVLQAACTEQQKVLATWWSLVLSSGVSPPSCGLALASLPAQQACLVQWKGYLGSLLQQVSALLGHLLSDQAS